MQAATPLPIPLALLKQWAYADVDVLHALEEGDRNFGPREPPKYRYDGTREDLVPIIDLRTVLDTADTSGELAALLGVLASDGTILKRTLKPGGPANQLVNGVEMNPYYLTGTLTTLQKQTPVVQRVVQYLQRITGLVVANVVLNVYSGDVGAGPTKLQGKHTDYSAKTPRVVVPLAVVGSSRFFRVTEDGRVLFEYPIKYGEPPVGLYMKGPTRGAGNGLMHGGCDDNVGISCSFHFTFKPDATTSDDAVLTRLKDSGAVVLRPIPKAEHHLGDDLKRMLARIVEEGSTYPLHNFAWLRAERAVPPLAACHPPSAIQVCAGTVPVPHTTREYRAGGSGSAGHPFTGGRAGRHLVEEGREPRDGPRAACAVPEARSFLRCIL
jgi:hypothetical protein